MTPHELNHWLFVLPITYSLFLSTLPLAVKHRAQ